MRIFLILISLIVVSYSTLCDEAQRTFYMSYPALSKRDAIGNLFDEITSNLTVLDSNYTDSNLQANFKITNLNSGTYYNDHYQV